VEYKPPPEEERKAAHTQLDLEVAHVIVDLKNPKIPINILNI
jgi:hypothetical protein